MKTALVALDWGSTSFRAYRMAEDGRVLESRSSDRGITSIPGGEFEATLRGAAGDWLAPGVPVIAGGMITSRNGWVETPYVDCPAGIAEIAGGLVQKALPDEVVLWFVPGLSSQIGMPDVIRGEEAQIVGASAEAGDGLYILPGTHSKWAAVEGGRVQGFATFPTGELYDVLRRHTLVGRLMQGDGQDAESFARGLRFGLEDGPPAGGLLRRIFSARTLGLFGEVAPAALGDYLSGLLVGAEIREGLALYPAASERSVVLIANPALSDRYTRALALAGIRARRGPTDAAAGGLFRLAGMGGLLR